MTGPKLKEVISVYQNSHQFNESVYKEFTHHTNNLEFLKRHRLYIEENELGFGDRAFHFMWYCILRDVFDQIDTPRCLEIGVFKGQVISLWKCIARELNRDVEITGITPLQGDYSPTANPIGKLLQKFNPKIRKRSKSDSLYEKEDYLGIIKNLFNHFDLRFDDVRILKGYSFEAAILEQIKDESFDLIYIDGDHAYESVVKDIENFAPKVKPGAYLIMDDAACNIPGGGEGSYWKGYPQVSEAVEAIPDFGFTNVLNVGHNRVFMKQA